MKNFTELPSELLISALVRWKGNPSDMGIHIKDEISGSPIPPSGSGKKLRSMGAAILRALKEKSENAPVLYRGDDKSPYENKSPVLGWTESKRTAQSFASQYGAKGKVYVLQGARGLNIQKIVGEFDAGENEWIVLNDAKTLNNHLEECMNSFRLWLLENDSCKTRL